MACNLSEPQQDNVPDKYVRCKDRPDLLLSTDVEYIEHSLGVDIRSEETANIVLDEIERHFDTSGIPFEKDNKRDTNASQKERKGCDRDDDTHIDGQLGKDFEVNKEIKRIHQESRPTFMCPENELHKLSCFNLMTRIRQEIYFENCMLGLLCERRQRKIEDIKQPEVCQESVENRPGYLSPETGELFIAKDFWCRQNNITDKTYSNEELQNQTVTFLPALNIRHQEITQPLPITDNGCRGNIPCIDSLLAEEITEPIKSSTKLKLKRKLSKQKVVEEKKRKTDYQDRRIYGHDGGFSHLGLRTEPDPVKDVPVRVQTAGNPTPYKQYLLSDHDPMWFVPRDQTEGDVFWCPGKGSRDGT